MTPVATRIDLAPSELTLRVGDAPEVVWGTKHSRCPLMTESDANTWLDVAVNAVELPPVAIAPAMSSRHLATAAIMARAELFTALGAMPSAQLIDASAVALVEAVVLHL